MSALSGVRIVELAESVAGEFCGRLLADFGAEVLKIERPGSGSPTRSLGPFAGGEPAADRSGLFAYLNTSKASVVLDLQSAAGIAELATLLEGADVLIDDHAPGWLEGVLPEGGAAAFPGLILCAISPFGQDAPAERTHATDLIVMHASGMGYHTPSASDPAKPPLKGPGRFLASYEAGLEGALCVAAALHRQDSTGAGTAIDLSAQEVLASRLDYVLGQMIAGDMDVGEERTRFDLGGPGGILPCADGYIYIFITTPDQWHGLCELMGDPAELRDFPADWLERGLTSERIATCREALIRWLSTLGRDEAAALAQGKGITLVSVNDMADLFRSPQLLQHRYFARVEHPIIGTVSHPTVGYHLSASPAGIAAAAPLLGAPGPARAGGKRARSAGGAAPGGGPLAGVRVLELTKVWAGPYAGKLLGFLGAEVIRVESRGSLDIARTYGVADIDKAPGFQAVNPGKLSVQIDMKKPEGAALVKRLAAECDIVIENLRPGALDRLGLGYEVLKAVREDIILTSMSMYGADGPLAWQTGYAPCFCALSGMSSLVGYAGEPPVGLNVRYADSTFGAAAAFASLVALAHRRRTGEGQFVDVSAVEVLVGLIGDVAMDYALNGYVAVCDGNRHPDMAPHGLYPTKEGEWIALAVRSDREWQTLAAMMAEDGLAGGSCFDVLAGRKAGEAALDELVGRWTRGFEATALAAKLQSCGIPAAKSATSVDLLSDGHLWARQFYRHVAGCDGDERAVLGPPWRLSGAAAIERPAPRLGEHNAYVFGEIMGLTPEEQQRLTAAGAIR